MNKYNLIMEKVAEYNENYTVGTPQELAETFNNLFKLNQQTEEVLALICMNIKLEIIGYFEVHRGSLNRSIIDMKSIFKRVILSNASAIAIAHNHPSGQAYASKDDIYMTKSVIKACEIFEIAFIDHIIVGNEKAYYSIKSNENI